MNINGPPGLVNNQDVIYRNGAARVRRAASSVAVKPSLAILTKSPEFSSRCDWAL
jgi:hypothetical protein